MGEGKAAEKELACERHHTMGEGGEAHRERRQVELVRGKFVLLDWEYKRETGDCVEERGCDWRREREMDGGQCT